MKLRAKKGSLLYVRTGPIKYPRPEDFIDFASKHILCLKYFSKLICVCVCSRTNNFRYDLVFRFLSYNI